MSSIAVTASASGAGVITLQAPVTSTNRTLTLPDSTGTMATAESTLAQFNVTGAAPVYACRAWVNFNGTGTVAIRASGNVSSITDNGVGNYTVNFTTAMPDASYCPVVGMSQGAAAGGVHQLGQTGPNLNSNNFSEFGTGSLKIVTGSPGASTPFDVNSLNVAIFR